MRRQRRKDTVVRYWIRAISRCLRVFSNTGKNSPRPVERSLRIMVNDRTIKTRCRGTIRVITGSLDAATFPRMIRISCTRLPECHP